MATVRWDYVQYGLFVLEFQKKTKDGRRRRRRQCQSECECECECERNGVTRSILTIDDASAITGRSGEAKRREKACLLVKTLWLLGTVSIGDS